MLRRKVVALLAILAMLTVVACDAEEPEPSAEPDEAETGKDGEQAASGPQELVVGIGADTYNTEEPEADVGDSPRAIFEGLVTMTPEYEVEPQLATAWELVEPNTWRFELREDVVFHDGTPFTAEAVKYTFDRIAEAGGGRLFFGEDSTEVVDDYTVEVTPTRENRRLVEQLISTMILAPDSRPGEEPIGTGPFRYVDYQPQETLEVERNDDYWGEATSLDRITFRFIPEANARRLALESGEIDLMLDVPLDDVSTLEAGGFTVDVPQPGLYEAMYANIGGAEGYTTLQDLEVRQAVGYAIDREALVEGVFDGLASSEQTVIPARLLGEHADTIEGYEHDPQRAGELLDEAGWELGDDDVRQRDGESLTLELINGFPSAEEHGAVAEFVQAQLADVGIQVEVITAPDTASYQERLNAFEGDLWLEKGNQNDANPAFLPALLFWNEGIFGNLGYQPLFAPGSWPTGEGEPRVGDGTFDEVIQEALATPDPDEVKELSAEAMHLLIDEHAIVLPLAGLVRPAAFREGVEGFEAHPSNENNRFHTVSISE